MRSDPVSTMSDDHAHARDLADRLGKAVEQGDAATANALAKELADALNAHTAVEEEAFYPALLKVAPDLAAKVEEVLEGHAAAKSLLYEALMSRSETGGDDEVMPEAELLVEAVERHTAGEEELFETIRETDRDSELAQVASERIDEKQHILESAHNPDDDEVDESDKSKRRKKSAEMIAGAGREAAASEVRVR